VGSAQEGQRHWPSESTSSQPRAVVVQVLEGSEADVFRSVGEELMLEGTD
jgi:hypothetical protein